MLGIVIDFIVEWHIGAVVFGVVARGCKSERSLFFFVDAKCGGHPLVDPLVVLHDVDVDAVQEQHAKGVVPSDLAVVDHHDEDDHGEGVEDGVPEQGPPSHRNLLRSQKDCKGRK